MFRKLFVDHPATAGETYLEHQATALSFAGPLFVAAFAATVHAFVPGLCQKTASGAIQRLNRRLTGEGRG